MRVLLRIFLVAVLTGAMVAAGVGWMQCYVAPLAERAAQKPDPPEAIGDDLPPECLKELAPADDRPVRAATAGEAARAPIQEEKQAEAGGGNPLRPANDIAQAPAELPASSAAAARPIGLAQSADWNDPPAARPVAAQPAAGRSARQSQSATLPVSVEEPLPAGAKFHALRSDDVLDLMRRLRADEVDVRNEARRELVRRGFSEVDLELARQLFSPDAEARKQLARSVPRLTSVDAARWLMWLAHDPQPEVRLAAVSTLATTGDPALLDRVESLARKDPDEQIQAMADRIARQRDLAAAQGAPASRFGRR